MRLEIYQHTTMIDWENTLTITRNDACFYIQSFGDRSDNHDIQFYNLHIQGVGNGKWRGKWAATKAALRFIWKRKEQGVYEQKGISNKES